MTLSSIISAPSSQNESSNCQLEQEEQEAGLSGQGTAPGINRSEIRTAIKAIVFSNPPLSHSGRFCAYSYIK